MTKRLSIIVPVYNVLFVILTNSSKWLYLLFSKKHVAT